MDHVADEMSDVRFEILLVDDGSADGSARLCRDKSNCDTRYRYVKLSRNFGHQAAQLAGMREATGDGVVFIDSDLQDPPELIPSLVERWKSGVDVVHAKRNRRHGETFFKVWTARIFYRMMNWLSDVDLPENVGDFRLVDRRVIDIVSNISERSLYLRGLFVWVGFEQAFVTYDRDERFAGSTKYSLRKMVKLGADAVLSFSDKPLRLMTRSGLLLTICSVAAGCFLLLKNWVDDSSATPGWLSLVLLILFLGGIQISFLGLVGGYVSRIFTESKDRPSYIVDTGQEAHD